jgi:DNA replication protein DnaC
MSIENFIEKSFAAMLRTTRERNEEVQRFIAAQPQEIFCKNHPHVARPISLERTRRASAENHGELTARYEPCPLCAEERAEAEIRERLHRQGVPENLLNATLGNWTPDAANAGHLGRVREFITRKRGFLILLGDVGTGKTHLAVGVMRHFQNAFFVKQNTLLRKLRETYRDRAAVDPVAQCQDTGLLVLDEMGLSSGGRDELPLLHEVLDYRHCERKPTILTGNLNWQGLTAIIGQRLSDRLKESAFRVLVFKGESKRRDAREQYFEQ